MGLVSLVVVVLVSVILLVWVVIFVVSCLFILLLIIVSVWVSVWLVMLVVSVFVCGFVEIVIVGWFVWVGVIVFVLKFCSCDEKVGGISVELYIVVVLSSCLVLFGEIIWMLNLFLFKLEIRLVIICWFVGLVFLFINVIGKCCKLVMGFRMLFR